MVFQERPLCKRGNGEEIFKAVCASSSRLSRKQLCTNCGKGMGRFAAKSIRYALLQQNSGFLAVFFFQLKQSMPTYVPSELTCLHNDATKLELGENRPAAAGQLIVAITTTERRKQKSVLLGEREQANFSSTQELRQIIDG